MRKLILLLALMFVVVPSVLALSQIEKNQIKNNMIFNFIASTTCYEDNATGQDGTLTATVGFSTANQSCHFNGGRVTWDNNAKNSASHNQTFIVYTNSTWDNDLVGPMFFTQGEAGTAGDVVMQYDSRATGNCGASNCLGGLVYDSAGNAIIAEAATDSWSANSSFKMLTLTINETGTALSVVAYLNSRPLVTATAANPIVGRDVDLVVGNRGGGDLPAYGHYYAAMKINRTLTTDQLNYIMDRFQAGDYNLTDAVPIVEPDVRRYTITARDTYDSEALQNFTLSVFNASNSFDFTTGNGTIHIDNRTIQKFNMTYNFTFASNQSGGYFNHTVIFNITPSASGQGDLWQAEVYVNATEVFTGNWIGSFLATLPLQRNQSQAIPTCGLGINCTGVSKLLVKAGTYTLVGNKTGYMNASVTFTVSALSESRQTLEFATFNLNVKAINRLTNAFITSFSIIAQNGSYLKNVSTTNGNASFDLINGTYNLQFSGSGFSNQNVSLLLLSNSTYYNYTFLVYTANSFNLTVWDEVLGRGVPAFFNKSVTVQVISDTYGANYTIMNGSLYVDLLSPTEYRITVSSDQYTKRDYYLTLSNNSHNDLEAFLLSTGNSTEVTFTVKDSSGVALENALIMLKRGYIISPNTYSYLSVAHAKTDVEGKAVINVDFNDAFYQIVASRNNSVLNTIGAKIFSTEINLVLNLIPSAFSSIDALGKTVTSLSFNNITKTFSYSFTNLLGTSLTGRLVVNREENGDVANICSTSTTASSGTLLCVWNISNQTGNYYATGSIDTGQDVGFGITNTLTIITGFADQAKNVFGKTGVLLSIMLGGATATLFIWSPAAMIIMFLVSFGVMINVGLSFMSIGLFLGIIIIGLAIVIRMR